MSTRWNGLVFIALLGVLGPAAISEEQLSAQEMARKVRAYDNPQVFAEMSGAKQAALERRFGRRPVRGVAITGEEFTEDAARMFAAPLNPLANVRVNDPTADGTNQDTQSETAVLFGTEQNIIAAYNDSGSHVGGAARFTGWALSVDGGATFTDKGTLPDSSDGDAGDPVLARSSKTKTIFLATLSFNTGHKLLIFRSTDNGTSFQPPVNGTPGFNTSSGEQDKEWIAVDNTAGDGFGNVYMFWRNFAAGGGMTFTRSSDDGQTWGPDGGLKLADGGQGAQVTVGKDHAVYVFWYDSSVTPRELRMRKSADQGASFGPPVTVAKLRATGINGDLGLNPGFRTSSFPQAAASPSNAGHLFIVYNDQTGSGATLDRGDIYFARSSDGGSSWSAPVKVNDDATRRDQWQPSLALSLDGKRLCLAWYDRRLDPLNNLIDRFGVIGRITTSGAVTFDNNFRITNEAFPPVVGVDPMVNALYMGDYDQMASNDVHFGTTWGDNRDNSTGHAGKNANVRFAKILAAGAAGGSPSGEGSNEIAVSELPEFAVSAIRRAIDEAPAETVAKPVVWEKAFEMAETIAMYQLKGKDAKGRILEVETKGIRVIEIEVKLPTTNVPEALIASAKKLSPDFHPRQWTAVIVAGKIVNYEVLGSSMSDESTPLNFTHGIGEPREVKVEATFTSEGKLSGRRIRD